MNLGRYSLRRKMTGKGLFLPLKGPKSNANYNFLTPSGLVPFTFQKKIAILHIVPLSKAVSFVNTVKNKNKTIWMLQERLSFEHVALGFLILLIGTVLAALGTRTLATL